MKGTFTMKTLSINVNNEELLSLIVEWNELLAQEKYAEAIDLIIYDNTQDIDGNVWIWTPEKPKAAVFTYGMPWFSREQIEEQFGAGSADYKVTTLLPVSENKLRDEFELSIEYFDDAITPDRAKLWGISKLDYENIIGEILYNIPLNGTVSDLTAMFWIVKVNETEITLLFRDLHVM